MAADFISAMSGQMVTTTDHTKQHLESSELKNELFDVDSIPVVQLIATTHSRKQSEYSGVFRMSFTRCTTSYKARISLFCAILLLHQ